MSGNQEYDNTNHASYHRYKDAQNATGGTSGDDRVDKTTEEYLGRLENKYNKIEYGEPVDKGHQQSINDLGNSFRKTTGLPKYKQTDPTGRN